MPQEDIFLLCRKNSTDKIELSYEFIENIEAPVSEGDIVGKIYVIKNGEVVKEGNIISKTTVFRRNYIDNINKAIDNWKIAG